MKQLLRDPATQPSDDTLRPALGDSFSAWHALNEKLDSCKISVEWRYYNDGKAWLAKAVSGKKTVFWGSAWEGFFKTSFYFTEKTRIGIQELEIEENLKNAIANAQPIGKLFPLVIDVYSESQLPDLLKIIDYKQRLK